MPVDQNIPILVVNLTRSKERRVYMQEQLDAFGVRYEFYSAVDGNALTPQQRACYSEEESVRQFGYPLTNGEIGCALSHLQIYEKMVAEDIAELLILEDDAAIKKDFFSIIFQRAQWAPADWKMLHFATKKDDTTNNTLPYYFIDTQKRYRLYRYTEYYNRTHCYIVKQESAKWLIKAGYPIHFPADILKGKTYSLLRCYTVVPEICSVNDNIDSIIELNPIIQERYASIIKKNMAYQKVNTNLIKKIGFLFSAHYSTYRSYRKVCRLLNKYKKNIPQVILKILVLLRDIVVFYGPASALRRWHWKSTKIRIEG